MRRHAERQVLTLNGAGGNVLRRASGDVTAYRYYGGVGAARSGSRRSDLEKHVAVVTALMSVSPDWDTFQKLFNKNFWPYIPGQTDMFEQDDKEGAY